MSEVGVAGATPVSIVIVSWNSRELLLETLRSLLPLEGVQSEVILVDNASRDGSADAAQAAFPEIRVIRNDRNLGFAAGVNIGLRAGRYPLLLLLNPDTRVVGDAIAKLVAYADATPAAGILGPRVLNEDGTLQPSRFMFPSLLNQVLLASYLYKLFPDSRFFNRERFGGRAANIPQRADVVSGCCFLVRRELLDSIGMLDESFFMYAEETDLCYRAWEAGWEVHYVPDGTIVHIGGGSSRFAARRNFLEIRRSILRFFAKHRGRSSARAAQALMLVYLFARIPYWAVRSVVDHDRSVASSQLGNHLSGVAFLAKPLSKILEGEGLQG